MYIYIKKIYATVKIFVNVQILAADIDKENGQNHAKPIETNPTYHIIFICFGIGVWFDLLNLPFRSYLNLAMPIAL